MKRIISATLAAATACALSVAPATAAENRQSSEVTDTELGLAMGWGAFTEVFTKKDNFTSSIDAMMKDENIKKDDAEPLMSSFRNDLVNGYKFGTTFEILIGTGIAALVLGGIAAAVQAGLIPGI